MVRLFSEEMMAGGSFNCLAYSVAFFSCFFVTCILAEAKSITINVVKGITNNDAYVVSLGTGETITVKLKRSGRFLLECFDARTWRSSVAVIFICI
ncbi:conserved hypothetical protein [Neospora caninum Liverpool]|uniref:Uncharacterized protein n=1 Tax=Neospora caninum (strain Liverpool) TaxID=572307 RepID=F0V949_NEOCL|nr:conserved hypothetical protein [Neospora caninum Liverpool]CBZ50274.1 conserved hypothetical protein [Neospora caninum Liverpool]|eukprot:XP_003880308.1 conserved hypothetical protein [Neospora caninum Liverpool]